MKAEVGVPALAHRSGASSIEVAKTLWRLEALPALTKLGEGNAFAEPVRFG